MRHFYESFVFSILETAMVEKSESNSGTMASKNAFKALGLSSTASLEEINSAFKSKLREIQRKYGDRPERLVPEAETLYTAYRSAYLSKDGPEDHMLPLTLTGPDDILNSYGIYDVPHQSMKVQMQSQAQYKDGQLVKNATSKTETVTHKDGKREIKVYENGKLIRHVIDGKDMLK